MATTPATTPATKLRHTWPSCPFCSFYVTSNEEKDMYILMHHLEMNHPENGSSPFVARDESPRGRQSQSRSRTRYPSGLSRERWSRSHSLTPSVDGVIEDVFVECPVNCGEAVHIRELEDHMDLHEIEDSSFDGASRPGSSRCTSPRPESRGKADPEPTLKSPPSTSRRSSKLYVPQNRDSSRGKRKDYSMLSGLKKLFKGPVPRETRPILPPTRLGAVKRLGVGLDVPQLKRC